MTLTQFINYIQYSTVRPDRVSVVRWDAMIKYAKKHGIISWIIKESYWQTTISKYNGKHDKKQQQQQGEHNGQGNRQHHHRRLYLSNHCG